MSFHPQEACLIRTRFTPAGKQPCFLLLSKHTRPYRGWAHPVERPSESLWHLETRPPLLGQTEGLRPCRSEPACPCDPPGLGGPMPPLKPRSPHQHLSSHSQPCGQHTHGPAPSDLWMAAPSRMSLPVCAGHVSALSVVIHSTTVGQRGWF